MPKYNKEEAIKTIQGLEATEIFVHTPEEQATLLENFKKTTIEQELKSRIAKVYDDVDADFTTITGLQKPADVKTYKYWPEVVKQFKEESETAKKEVEKLKVGGSPDLLKEIEALRKASIEKDNDWKAKYDKMQSDLAQKDVKNILDASTRSLKFANMPKPVLDTFIDNAKSKLAAKGKIVDGQLVFMDADGNPRINKETFKPYTAEELMAIELDPIIDKINQKPGAGTKPPEVKKDKDGKDDIDVAIPVNVQSKLELTKFLIETAGLPYNTPKFNLAFDKYSKNLPL
ncbi:MAG: hypothetical protein M0P47_09195 [Bacteroidales bacterium]|nr:hypothetical protein [Bacteroidales bacterium]